MDLFGRCETFGERSVEVGSAPVKVEVPGPAKLDDITVNPCLLPSSSKKLRVMICGTYPVGQSNGYSRVMYYIAKYLGQKPDITLTIYGFQNFRQTTTSQRNDIPKNVILHDALATEDPKRSGFGDKEIAGYLKQHPQDIVVIFNDMVVTNMLVKDIVEKLSAEERKSFKLVSYMDQVYPHQRPEFIKMLNEHFDAVVAFTPYWKSVVRKLGLLESIPVYYFQHGFDNKLYYPMPKKLARLYYDLPLDAFIILNLNRNQPRKRWDHCLMAYVRVIKKHLEFKTTQPKARPMRLMVGTMMNGFWDLMELFEAELKRFDIPLEVGKEYLAVLEKPQQQTDRDINILYNACDIGFNPCEGEGFGLCQFEHLAVGCPQVVANIGGFKEFIHKDNSSMVEPKWFYYVDKVRDGIGGYAEVSDPSDFAEAIWKYYLNPKLVANHGMRGREDILKGYKWDVLVDRFYQNLLGIKARAWI